MEKWTVVVTDYDFPDIRQERETLEPLGFRFVVGQCKTAQDVSDLCVDADAVLTQWAPVTAEAIERMTTCKIIVRYGIGVDSVDLEAAKRKHIAVVNVPDYGVQEVADHALTLLLSSVRKVEQIAAHVRAGNWPLDPHRPIMGLGGKTLGLAGFGNIARAVSKRAQAFGLHIIAYDPYVAASAFAAEGAEQVEWEDLLGRSDLISVHLPLTGRTRHIFNRRAFQLMKPNAFLINTSRGGVIHTGDLTEALKTKRIAGAGLDVLEEEPVLADNPLLQLEQCVITNHCAWYSEESLSRLQLYAALEIKRMFSGEWPKHVVNGVVKE